MTVEPLESRREPAEWTAEHRALRDSMAAAGIPVDDAHPEWEVTVWAVIDANGAPAGVTEQRSAAVTNCRPPAE